jgi:Tol biopolymer transport system component
MMRTRIRAAFVVAAALALAAAAVISPVDVPGSVSPAGAVPTALPSPLPASYVIYDSVSCAPPATSCTTARNWELYAQDTSTGTVYQLTDDVRFDSWWPKLSPDRTKIMFIRSDAGTKDQDWSKNSLWILPVNGSGPATPFVRSLNGVANTASYGYNTGWSFIGHPEWAPTQDRIAIIGTQFTPAVGLDTLQIFVMPFNNTTNSISGAPWRITHGANFSTPRPEIMNLDPSWNPDGLSVLFSGCKLNAGRTACDTSVSPLEIHVTSAAPATLNELQLTNTTDKTLNYDAYFAPNSTQIAWLHASYCSKWDIRHGTPNGLGLLTNVSTVIDDGKTNSKPAFTANSANVFFHKYGDIESTLWSIPAAGGSPTQTSISGTPAQRCSADHPSLWSGAAGTPPGASPLAATTSVFASNRCDLVATPTCTKPGTWQIYSRTSGGTITQLTSGNVDHFAPQVSPDRSTILFLQAKNGQKGDSAAHELWIMRADGTLYGSSPALAAGPSAPFFRLNNATWSPDGSYIVFDASTPVQEAKGPGPNMNNQIWWMNYNAGAGTVGPLIRQVTWGPSGAGDRPGNNIQPAWNPDGGSILFVGCTPNAGRTACNGTYSTGDVHLVSSTSSTVDVQRTTTTDTTIWAHPTPSPNGTYFAAVHQLTCRTSAIVRVNAIGTSPTVLTSPGSYVNNPSWNSTSTTVYYDKLAADVTPMIWKITPNAPSAPGPNGTSATQITGQAGSQTPCAADFPNAGNF